MTPLKKANKRQFNIRSKCVIFRKLAALSSLKKISQIYVTTSKERSKQNVKRHLEDKEKFRKSVKRHRDKKKSRQNVKRLGKEKWWQSVKRLGKEKWWQSVKRLRDIKKSRQNLNRLGIEKWRKSSVNGKTT
jgi:hypothetical protein